METLQSSYAPGVCVCVCVWGGGGCTLIFSCYVDLDQPSTV